MKPLLDLIESVLQQGGRYQVAGSRVIFTDARGNRWDCESKDDFALLTARTAECLQPG
jgi:hypothetical protein